MNSSRKLGWFLASALAPIFSSLAFPVNDGSTTNNLTQIFNSSPDSQGAAVVGLQLANCSTNCSLTAVQTGKSAFFALRSAWYANDVAPTSGVYTVSAAFEPADVANQNRGGVIGWLSLNASNGIILQVVPEDSPFSDDPKSFRVALVDFSADNGNDNESLAHLFNTNGTSASGASVWSDLGTNYSATNFATFQLAFSAPTTPDLAALSNATAHITAKVFQGTNGTPIQVSRTVELLTDLPLPSRGNHRIGYYAVWADSNVDGSTIGYLDNLTGEGGVGSTTGGGPTLKIVLAANNTNNIEISWLMEGYQLQMATNLSSPTWLDVPNTLLTNRVTLTISGGSAFFRLFQPSAPTGPRLTILLSDTSVVVSWPPQVTGYRLQSKSDLNAAIWTEVATTNNQVREIITGTSRFYRLSQ